MKKSQFTDKYTDKKSTIQIKVALGKAQKNKPKNVIKGDFRLK
jgi:hypothetical protein